MLFFDDVGGKLAISSFTMSHASAFDGIIPYFLIFLTFLFKICIINSAQTKRVPFSTIIPRFRPKNGTRETETAPPLVGTLF